MKKHLLSLALTCLFAGTFAQNALVINNDAYVVLDGGTAGTPIYVVVDQANQLGITTLGTGGNIISEGEYNKIQWNIGTTTGTYTVPFTSNNGAGDQKIPLSIQTTGGAAGANGMLRLSTWETDDANSAGMWPDDVTHLTNAVTGTGPNGANVVDRFWIVSADNYTTKPGATISFMYNDNNEIDGANNITSGGTESDLIAQNFEPGPDLWHGSPSTSGGWYGTWVSARTVNNVTVTDADWFDSWTLSLRSQLLPIELTELTVNCVNGNSLIEWSTASETNNDHFRIERSDDGVYFETVATLPGAGNSSSPREYSYTDYGAGAGTIYYRLTQVDFDGTSTSSQIIVIEGCAGNIGDITVFAGSESDLNINISAAGNSQYNIRLIDSRGRLVMAPKNLNVAEGTNTFILPIDEVSLGAYHVIIENDTERIVKKIVLH